MRQRLHLLFGAGLLVFIAAHLANHLALANGSTDHIATMEALRTFYRHPVVEPLLIVGLIIQLALGLRLALRRGRPQSGWAWAQVTSGGYLFVFLLMHVPAVLFGRLVQSLDTNIFFAAATVHETPMSLFFAPYYTLAVTAVFLHLAAALRFAMWPRTTPWLVVLPALGFILGIWIVAKMMSLHVPPAYL